MLSLCSGSTIHRSEIDYSQRKQMESSVQQDEITSTRHNYQTMSHHKTHPEISDNDAAFGTSDFGHRLRVLLISFFLWEERKTGDLSHSNCKM